MNDSENIVLPDEATIQPKSQYVLILILVVLVCVGIGLGWLSGNDRLGDQISVSQTSDTIQVDFDGDLLLLMSVRNSSGKSVRLERIDAESSCRTTFSIDGLPMTLPPHDQVSVSAAIQLEEGHVLPIDSRKTELPVALLPVIRGVDGNLWVTRQQTQPLHLRRSIVSSRQRIALRGDDGSQGGASIRSRVVLELYEDIDSLQATAERLTPESSVWEPDMETFDIVLQRPDPNHRILEISLKKPLLLAGTERPSFRVSVRGNHPDGTECVCRIPIELINF